MDNPTNASEIRKNLGRKLSGKQYTFYGQNKRSKSTASIQYANKNRTGYIPTIYPK